MATVEKAEELLEKLRSASWNAAVQGVISVLFLYSCLCFSYEFYFLCGRIRVNEGILVKSLFDWDYDLWLQLQGGQVLSFLQFSEN